MGSFPGHIACSVPLYTLDVEEDTVAIKKGKGPTAPKRGKATATKRSSRSKAPAAHAGDSLRSPWIASPRAFALTLVGVVVAVTFMTAGPMPQRSEFTDPEATPVADARLVAAPSSVRPEPVETPVQESATPGSVTVTGCLAKNSDGFWLKNASGGHLSAARSWKTGFLKKSSPRVNVIAATTAVKLSDYVGRRVSATGVLKDQDLRVHSVRRLSASCS